MRTIDIYELFGAEHPNACWHDSYIDRITLDYVARTAEFDCRICEGDPDEIGPRELWTPGRLKFTGLWFFCAEAPIENYSDEAEPLDVYSVDPWCPEIAERSSIRLPGDLPEDVFVLRFWINNWCSSLVVAATGTEFQWT